MLEWLACGHPWDVLSLTFPKHFVNVFDGVEELLGVLKADFYFTRAAELGCLPECVVELWKLFEMRWLEVIRPKNEQLIFCFLLFTHCLSKYLLIAHPTTNMPMPIHKIMRDISSGKLRT